jgi:hypothetical protein
VICSVEAFGEFAAAATLILNTRVVLCGVAAESFAWTVSEDDPAVVGMPEMTPVEAFSVKPAGSEPEARLQV